MHVTYKVNKDYWVSHKVFSKLSTSLHKTVMGLSTSICLFIDRIHIYIEPASDSFYHLPRNTFHDPKHDIHNLQTKEIDAKVGSSKPQVCV